MNFYRILICKIISILSLKMFLDGDLIIAGRKMLWMFVFIQYYLSINMVLYVHVLL